MSNETPISDVQAALSALLSQFQEKSGQPQAGGWSGWSKPQPPQPVGLAVPLSLETPSGRIRVYLQFAPEAASSPESVLSLLKALHETGYPLDLWEGKKGWDKGSNWRR